MTELPLQGEGLAVEREEGTLTFATEAGRRLAAWSARDRPVPPDDWLGMILEIEREAATARIAALEKALRDPKNWPTGKHRLDGYQRALDVLLEAAALQAEPSPETVERVAGRGRVDEAYAAGRLAGMEDGVAKTYDDGWLAGYELGLRHGRAERVPRP